MSDPFDVVRQFEAALCEYTGAKYAVTTTSCTMALLLACSFNSNPWLFTGAAKIAIPKRTYVGVPMSILHAGIAVEFTDDDWRGSYRLYPTRIADSARRFTSGMFVPCEMRCVSFHPTKILGLSTHGGAILHDLDTADRWLRRARFDGRTEGVAPRDDKIRHLGWHCYMTPVTAAEGLTRLTTLPKHNDDLSNSDYPDLSKLAIFR